MPPELAYLTQLTSLCICYNAIQGGWQRLLRKLQEIAMDYDGME